MNNKRHVRETENVLDDIILVDTPFKQAWIHGCNIVIVKRIALSVRLVPYHPCRALLYTDYAFPYRPCFALLYTDYAFPYRPCRALLYADYAFVRVA
jgi:hypothetical protein